MDALTNQVAQANITIKKADGSPGEVDGIPVWSSSDETVVTVTAAPDGMSATVETVAPSTVPARISVTADADLGAGTVPIVGVSEDINVTANPANQATAVVIGVGAFADKPAGP